MSVYAFGDWTPALAADSYVAPNGTVIGWVTLKSQASVWPGAVIRGDNEPIVIGERSNVQDGAVLHSDPGCALTVADDVSIGHQAMLHGCTVGAGSVIGIQAVVLNRAVIGQGCLVGAGALVTERKVFPDYSLILGAPAHVVRVLTADEQARLRENAAVYVRRAAQYRVRLRPVPEHGHEPEQK
jgi:carbonic anhydrase/acetyltransferase-like protein (isoleucine patch superfamily)